MKNIFKILSLFFAVIASIFTVGYYNAVTGVPIINGVSYAHADIVLNIGGAPIIGITSISYSDNQTIQANFSTGNKPTSVGFGVMEPKASMTMTMEAVQALLIAAPSGRLQNYPFFDIGINFLPDSGVFMRHSLKKCRFKGVDLSSSVNNTQIEVSLELFVADISYTG
jgi:hypothetical protein